MLYLILGEDVANSLPLRRQDGVRPAHIARIQQLKNEGRLITAGPNPAIDASDPGEAGFSGSLVIAEFASLQAAQQWADADPYIAHGVWQRVIVKPYLQVAP